ncbi:hypothetical protein AGLY_003318 [Aphis glycines]|uniref:YqaJ viral recombinase domain-containing protein n=1 Tax=Aphis glycines TaxID=307491 RepID=A0A6G0U0G2_APHGL|nr:hypothetical protein AGLY_003318 [Aphis glycines]
MYLHENPSPNYNNNAAESYNSILAKFVGGKRINFSKKGSYELRCNVAVTNYNSGMSRLSLFNKNITTKSPGLFTKRYVKKHESSFCQKRRRRLFCQLSIRSKIKASAGPDQNYGAVLEEIDPLENITDISMSVIIMSTSEYTNLQTKFLEKLKLSISEVQSLEKRTKRQHQCEEWHLERKKRLTASLFGRICKLRKTTSRDKVVSYMLFGTFKGNASTRYTVSPDGLVELDALVEIKCPANAKDFTPEDAIKNKKIKSCFIKNGNLFLNRNDNYYYQVQGQLHVTNWMYCYFCIWTPKGILIEKIQRDDHFWKTNMEVQLTS